MNNPRMRFRSVLWKQLLTELKERGAGEHESGAFLLGKEENGSLTVEHLIPYDDLDPHAHDSGACVLESPAFALLWQRCAALRSRVIADVHTHPGLAIQSAIDQRNPMIQVAGHIALIIPDFAQEAPRICDVGIYEYLGSYRWVSHGGPEAHRFLDVGAEP